MADLCPHCGQPLQRLERNALIGIDLSPMQRRILKALLDNLDGLNMSDLIGHVYDWGEREPEWPGGSIRVIIRYLRLKLEPVGWTITRNTGGYGKAGRYSLEKRA